MNVAEAFRVTGRLGRYKDIAWFVAKYGRAEFVTRAFSGSETRSADATAAEAFARSAPPS